MEYYIQMIGEYDQEGECLADFVIIQNVKSSECVLGMYNADDLTVVGEIDTREESLVFLDLYLKNMNYHKIYNYIYPDGEERIPTHIWKKDGDKEIAFVNGKKVSERIDIILEHEIAEMKHVRDSIYKNELSELDFDGSKPVQRDVYGDYKK